MSTKVYEVIRQVAAVMASEGIGKDNQNQQQKYKFRGIDDVYNALAPVLADKGLVIMPRLTERVMVERTTKSGGALFNVTVKAEFDFIAAEDGSLHTVATYGEAMDTADKATNKAMSAAYKYACFMTFCIPTEGDNDADSTTHEVTPKPKQGTTTGAKVSAKESAVKACDAYLSEDVDAYVAAHSNGEAQTFDDLKTDAQFRWLANDAYGGQVKAWINDRVPQ